MFVEPAVSVGALGVLVFVGTVIVFEKERTFGFSNEKSFICTTL